MSNAAKLTVSYIRRAVIVFEDLKLKWACCGEFREAVELHVIEVSEEDEFLPLNEEWDQDVCLRIRDDQSDCCMDIKFCPFCGERIVIKVELDEDIL